jgi:pyruvate dehydrogenase E2 component (dihydrolipoamide acetyltransferase)
VEVKLPELGENVEGGIVTNVLVSVGDTVETDQPVIEVETDKASVEVPAPEGGSVTEIHVRKGDEIGTGDLLLTLDGKRGGISEPSHERKDRGAAEDKGEEKQQPAQHARHADRKKRTQTNGEQGTKAATGARSRESERRRAADSEANEEWETPRPRRATSWRRPSTGVEEAEEASRTAPQDEPEDRRIVAAPSTRHAARELGVELADVDGTGPGDRILLEDVLRYARREGAIGEMKPKGRALPDFGKFGPVRREEATTIRRRTAEAMSQSWTTVPHVTLFDEADVTALDEIIDRYRHAADEAGGKLTITAILVKVVAAAMHAFPHANASYDPESDEIIFKDYRHIGIAVDTDAGLLVPVIRNADGKSIIELAVELTQLAERARAHKLAPDDMEGASFTLTNLGGIGIRQFTPIVNTPQAAILGVGRAARQPRYVDGELVPRTMLPLALSIDHRVLDGADGARLVRWIVDALREPLMIVMES